MCFQAFYGGRTLAHLATLGAPVRRRTPHRFEKSLFLKPPRNSGFGARLELAIICLDCMGFPPTSERIDLACASKRRLERMKLPSSSSDATHCYAARASGERARWELRLLHEMWTNPPGFLGKAWQCNCIEIRAVAVGLT